MIDGSERSTDFQLRTITVCVHSQLQTGFLRT